MEITDRTEMRVEELLSSLNVGGAERLCVVVPGAVSARSPRFQIRCPAVKLSPEAAQTNTDWLQKVGRVCL